MTKLLNAGEILAVQDLKTIEVEVPEWGGAVRLRELSARDREWYYAQTITEETVIVNGKEQTLQKTDIVDVRARLLSRAIVSEIGQPIFDDAEVKLLGGKSNAVIDRLFREAQKLSGMGATAVADAEKNSDAAPSGDSSSASPSPSAEPSASSSAA